MSSSKKRHVVYDIGTVAANSASKEFDLSSCTNAIVHMTRSGDGESITVRWEASAIPPGVDMGGSDVWYTLNNLDNSSTGEAPLQEMGFLWPASPTGNDVSILFGTGQAEAAPMMDSRAPRRARISIESTSVTLTSVKIEGTRSIA